MLRIRARAHVGRLEPQHALQARRLLESIGQLRDEAVDIVRLELRHQRLPATVRCKVGLQCCREVHDASRLPQRAVDESTRVEGATIARVIGFAVRLITASVALASRLSNRHLHSAPERQRRHLNKRLRLITREQCERTDFKLDWRPIAPPLRHARRRHVGVHLGDSQVWVEGALLGARREEANEQRMQTLDAGVRGCST